MPKLTEYLLKLATDAAELAAYREAKKKRRLISYLTAANGPGLTRAQAKVLNNAHKDTDAVTQSVVVELEKESSRPGQAFYGFAIHFASEINHVQVHIPPVTPPGHKRKPRRARKSGKTNARKAK